MINTTIHNIRLEKYFTTLPNAGAEDRRLSWAAKGLLWYLLSRPSDWKIYTWQLSREYFGYEDPKRGNGQNAIQSMMKELRSLGYVVYVKRKDDKGKWLHEYHVYPMAFDDFQKMFPEAVKPHLDKPSLVKRPIITKNDLEKNELIKNQRQQQAPSAVKKSATPPVVVSSLDKLRITPSTKQQILKKYSIPEIDIAVDRVLKWDGCEDHARGVRHWLKHPDKWEKPKENPEVIKEKKNNEIAERSKENKEWAIKYLEDRDHHPFTICENYVEYRDKQKRFGTIPYSLEKQEFKDNILYIYEQITGR